MTVPHRIWQYIRFRYCTDLKATPKALAEEVGGGISHLDIWERIKAEDWKSERNRNLDRLLEVVKKETAAELVAIMGKSVREAIEQYAAVRRKGLERMLRQLDGDEVPEVAEDTVVQVQRADKGGGHVIKRVRRTRLTSDSPALANAMRMEIQLLCRMMGLAPSDGDNKEVMKQAVASFADLARDSQRELEGPTNGTVQEAESA